RISKGCVRVVGGTAGDVNVPASSTGTFAADIPTTVGAHTLKLTQFTYQPGTVCVPPNPCTESYEITWPITVTLETLSPKAPVILSPTDPTHSPAQVPTTFNIV